MHEFVTHLLRRNNSSLEIDLFNVWHLLYLFVIFGGAVLLSFLWRNKPAMSKDKLLRTLAYLVIGLYIFDFFCMPLSDSYSGMDTDKLPFHFCTAVGVLVPFVQFSPRFSSVKKVIAVLAATSSLMYLCYPSSALGDIPPFCYKVVQTFAFHGCLLIWGVLNLALGEVELRWRTIWQEYVAVLMILVWAAFGNAVYADYNWFFIKESFFDFIPQKLMPAVVIFCVYGSIFVVYCGYFGIRAWLAHSAKKQEKVTV